MSLVLFKREQQLLKLRRDSRERIFNLKRIIHSVDQLQTYEFYLETYEQNLDEAIQFLKQNINNKLEYEELWLFLLYDCFITLDESYNGYKLLDLLLYSLKQIPQCIIQFFEYNIINLIIKYEDNLVLDILQIVLNSQVIKQKDVNIQSLINYLCSFIITNTQQILQILLILSNNLDCKLIIINNDVIMNKLLDENQQYQFERSKIMSRLSRGNISLVYYFYNTKYQLQNLLYLLPKYYLKIILRLICYDETGKLKEIMKQQNINYKIENLPQPVYIEFQDIIEEILLEFV